MKPAPFRLLRPTTLAEALDALSIHKSHAKLMAGGQSLMPMMNLRVATPEVVVDLARIDELRFIDAAADCIRIGAMTTQSALLSNDAVRLGAPLLHKALRSVGHVQTRARGTIGGSLSHADPAAEICLSAMLLGARLKVRSKDASREIAAADFFVSALTTALAPEEVLCEISIPRAGPAARSSFREYARRHGDFAIVAVGAQYDPAAETEPLRVTIGGVLDRPYTLKSASAFFGDRWEHADVMRMLVQELAELEINDDIHASSDYRLTVTKVLLSDCLKDVRA